MACRLFGAKPLPEPMLVNCHLDSWEQISVKFESEFYHFHSRKCIRNCRLPRCRSFCPRRDELTHWVRVTHICVSKMTIIGSDNGLSPGRRQAIIWINAGILLIWPLGTNFSEIYIEILTFSFTKIRLNVSSAKRRPFCLGLNVLIWILTHSRKESCDLSSGKCPSCGLRWKILWTFHS